MTSISINSKLDDIRSKIRIFDDLIRPLNDLGMIRFFVEPHRIWINAVENNINLGQSPTMDEVEGMDETIDRNIEDTTGSILAEMSNCISRLEDRETIWKPDWMGEHIESLKKQTDATRTRASTVYPIDANLVREINGLRNGIKEAANFITHLDRANGILIASDSRIEILSGYANYMYEYDKERLEAIRAKVQKAKETIYKMKSNKPEGNLEGAALKLLQSIQYEAIDIQFLEESMKENKKRNQKTINETNKILKLMDERMGALLSDERPGIIANCLMHRTIIEDIEKRIRTIKEKVADILSAPNESGLVGIKAFEIHNELTYINWDIEYIERKPMPGAFEYVDAFLNIIIELIVRTFSKIKEMLSELIRSVAIERS